MALVNTKVTALANADARPLLPTYQNQINGEVRVSGGVVNKGATDEDNSVYRFARLPSNARLLSRDINGENIAGLTALELGVYDVNEGAVINQNLLGVLDLDAAAVLESGKFPTIAPADSGKMLWELLGETEDTGKQYDICGTATTSGAADGDIAIDIYWTV